MARKGNPPLKECLARVEQAEVLVVMVAHRFGWIPGDQVVEDPNERKSITWLECEHAVRRGREVLAFLVDGEAEWPAEVREDHELVKAVQEERFTAELGLDIQWRVSRLKAFKAWLSERALRETFTATCRRLFDLYGQAVEGLIAHLRTERPQRDDERDEWTRDAD